MWLVLFGLICFWTGAGALVACLFGWPVAPMALVLGTLATIVAVFVFLLCQAASVRFPEEKGIDLQAYFGGTFRLKATTGGERLQH